MTATPKTPIATAIIFRAVMRSLGKNIQASTSPKTVIMD
jgi:hypothetical protein